MDLMNTVHIAAHLAISEVVVVSANKDVTFIAGDESADISNRYFATLKVDRHRNGNISQCHTAWALVGVDRTLGVTEFHVRE